MRESLYKLFALYNIYEQLGIFSEQTICHGNNTFSSEETREAWRIHSRVDHYFNIFKAIFKHNWRDIRDKETTQTTDKQNRKLFWEDVGGPEKGLCFAGVKPQ